MHLTLLEPLLLILMCCSCAGGGPSHEYAACLPKDIKLAEIVATPLSTSEARGPTKKITLKDTLKRLKAHCEKDKLMDGAGREIRFYRLIGCWGNPPEDYQEQLARQNEELQRLKQKFTVVEISCAQATPQQIH